MLLDVLYLNFSRGLQIETRILEGSDVARAVVDFARLRAVTQIFVTREKMGALRSWFASAFVQRLVHLAREMQVTVSQTDRRNKARSPYSRFTTVAHKASAHDGPIMEAAAR